MRATLVLLLLAVFASVAIVRAETDFMQAVSQVEGDCHPECRWQCDDPVCPAVCHPVCERPKCQIHCEETECAKCKIHCDKPQCNVRCPKDLCEKKDCPKCETVCSPANCRTQCEAPNAVCTPMCEATKCDWKCKKPITCPKPKCELVCERPACDTRARKAGTKPGCCSCADPANLAATIRAANALLIEQSSEATEMMPSFMEVMHSVKAQTQEGKGMCCKCAA